MNLDLYTHFDERKAAHSSQNGFIKPENQSIEVDFELFCGCIDPFRMIHRMKILITKP